MLYPIVFIIGFLLSGIWFSFHIYVSQKLKNTKKALMFSPLLTAIIPTIIIWLLIGKEGIDVFALAYRNHTDDHYMVADR